MVVHQLRLEKDSGYVREWICDTCGRHIIEGHNQPYKVIKKGDVNAKHIAAKNASKDIQRISGLSLLWLEEIELAFENSEEDNNE